MAVAGFAGFAGREQLAIRVNALDAWPIALANPVATMGAAANAAPA
jgi:hypothetical protein